VLRTVKWVVSASIIDGLLLMILSWIVPGFDLSGFGAAILMAVIGVAAGSVIWPIVYWLSTRFHPILFPILVFLLTGVSILVIVELMDWIDAGLVHVDGVWTAILVAMGLTAANTVLAALFSIDDQRTYDRFVTSRIRKMAGSVPSTDVPGVVFIEIDGLSETVLQSAISGGYMPTAERWIASGEYQLRTWEPDLSSQTSASQAGILLGSNEGIPAFRWWDKPSGTLMVSSKMATARALEQQLSSGDGLLAGGGASRWNVFSGDASDCLGTYSQIGRGTTGGQRSYFAYLSSPYSLARTTSLFVTDVVREWIEAARQRTANVQPRIHRGFKYSLVRAGTTVLLQEASVFMLTADMYRGVPSVYSTFFAYDEVAHHSGIERIDSLKVLRTLDRVLAHFERVARDTPRPYHLVVLSDHGQSQGATFKQRFGITLAQLVDELTNTPHGVSELANGSEGLSSINSALTEAIRHDSRSMQLIRRATRDRVEDGQVSLDPDNDTSAMDNHALKRSDAVVVASGNLGLISFPRVPQRMTYEQILVAYPGLLLGLAEHEGISFVMVQSESEGGLVVGPRGVHYLADGQVVGVDPLAPFGPNAAAHLARTNGFPNAPDILVMSMFDAETGEVAAFEELVGSHGGMGGPQTRPFVLFPAELAIDPQQPIVGAGELHRVLKSWTPSAPHPAPSPVTV
jgi:uncharacterized membrane protein YvlD (DUF360 family)